MLKTARCLGFAAVILASALLFGSRPASAQAKDPLNGTWVLNFGKSDFKLLNPPTSKTLTFAAGENGFTEKSWVLYANGGNGTFINRVEFTAKYDGSEASMPPESPLNSITVRKIDANTIEQTGIIRKKAVETFACKLSSDGKTLTVTTVGKDDPANDSVQVYDKQ
jgi:hypothetical protein